MYDQYLAPYELAPHHARVAVMGAGGGMDVQGALLAGAEHVDAVEIEPKLFAISKRTNASVVSDDPRVSLHVDDARAFLRNTPEHFDLIAFGYLDSQSLFNSMSSLRIDGYIYTVESMRQAWSRLNDQGMLALSFYAGTGRCWSFRCRFSLPGSCSRPRSAAARTRLPALARI